jgi:hypothetical protein
MKQIITQVLNEKLCDEGPNAVYQADKVSALTKDIADAIKASLKAANYPRYKYLVQVVIGEQRGEGVR